MLPEWLIEKVNDFDTKYKIKNFFEITFSIISKLQVKSRKIVCQISTISQSLIMYNFYILYFQTFMHFTFTTLASMYPFMSTLSFLFNWL